MRPCSLNWSPPRPEPVRSEIVVRGEVLRVGVFRLDGSDLEPITICQRRNREPLRSLEIQQIDLRVPIALYEETSILVEIPDAQVRERVLLRRRVQRPQDL